MPVCILILQIFQIDTALIFANLYIKDIKIAIKDIKIAIKEIKITIKDIKISLKELDLKMIEYPKYFIYDQDD